MSNQLAINAPTFIEDLRAELAPILAENGQSFDRLRTVFMIAVQENPDILKCTPESLRRELSKCAADGLVPDAKEAVLLPYWDKGAKGFLANYQPMVHGVIKRLRELGGVFQIVCNLVYEHDFYEENEADPDSLKHIPPKFGVARGEIVGGYVIFRDDQKRIMHFEKMSRADFDQVRSASKSPNSPAWTKWFGEMCRKAVLRRGAKYLSTNNDKIRALIERTDSFFDFNAAPAVERINPFAGQATVIDHTAATGGQQIEDQRGRQEPAAMDAGGAGQKEPARQRQKEQARDPNKAGSKEQSSADKSAESASGQDQKKPDLPATPPAAPNVDVRDEDKGSAQECAEKILNLALEPNLDPGERRQNLKGAVGNWKSTLPEYLHPFLKACVDMSDWCIRAAAAGQAWQAEHAQFAYKVKTLLGIEKLNLSKYP